MALVVCKLCKKAFLSGLQKEDFCLDCVARLRELYPSVRNFLRNHHEEIYTAHSLGKIMDIAPEDVDSMVSIGLLEYREESRKTASGGKAGLYARPDKNKTSPGGSMKT